MRQLEKNRLEAAVPAGPVRTSLGEHIAYLDEQIERTKKRIAEHIDQSPTLKAQRDLLATIPGIAGTSAAALVAERWDVSLFVGAGQVAAFAGLVPKIRESGPSARSGSSLSKLGSSVLRKALYFPAMVALGFNAREGTGRAMDLGALCR